MFLTSVVQQSVSIGPGHMNLAFVRGPAARHPRHSPPNPRGRPVRGRAPALQVRNNALFAECLRVCAGGKMETQRLRAIQHPNRATTLLESWASTQDMIPVDARRIRTVSELSGPLRGLAGRLNTDESVWCSWIDVHRIWFVAAAPSLDLGRERKKPVLKIKIYNERGEMTAAADYVHTRDHGWQRCA